MVVDPWCSLREIGAADREIFLVFDAETDGVGLPLHAEDMAVIAELLTIGQLELASYTVAAPSKT